ncbi:hemolymph lipopolysaccharide-binding protein [Anabrus simplex]|uniref:hemolymph lipopolysaccharide-binding protein n=1 Tax=Anabrus simplex TaxID=316456 RepID=UPI0035A2E54C
MEALLLVLCVLGLVSLGTTNLTDTCSSQATTAVRFSVTGALNGTGHRFFQVDLRGNVPAGDDAGLFVEHWTEQCEDRKIVALNVSFVTTSNNTAENTTIESSVPKMTKGVKRRPRRLDYCLLVPGMGAYKVHEKACTWASAKKACEDEGSHLAVIETKEEFDLLSDMLRRVGQSWSHITLWIGVHRVNGSTWRNVFGRPLGHLGFLKWGSGWPSDHGDCGALRVYLVQKKIRYLSDAKCNAALFYLCEQEL